MSAWRVLAGLALLLAPEPATLAAQSGSSGVAAKVFVRGRLRSTLLSARGVTNLAFGSVAAGGTYVPASIATDAGRFNIAGRGDAPITITFILPAVLTEPTGGSIPIAFGPTDGIEWSAFPVSSVRFNPNAPYLTTLDNNGLRVISILGTISPPSSTVTAQYTGTIRIIVTYSP